MLGLRSHHHDHRRKRCGLFTLIKVQPSSDKSYLVFAVYVIVEVFCICSSWYQQYDSCTVLTFPVCFLNPERHLPTIRRVTKYCPPPRLRQAVLLFGEISFTLCVLGSSTGIESEAELCIEFIEQFTRGSPFFGVACKESFVQHYFRLQCVNLYLMMYQICSM